MQQHSSQSRNIGHPDKAADAVAHALPRQTVINYHSQRHNRLPISSCTLWISFWLAKTSHKSISLTARLAVNINSLRMAFVNCAPHQPLLCEGEGAQKEGAAQGSCFVWCMLSHRIRQAAHAIRCWSSQAVDLPGAFSPFMHAISHGHRATVRTWFLIVRIFCHDVNSGRRCSSRDIQHTVGVAGGARLGSLTEAFMYATCTQHVGWLLRPMKGLLWVSLSPKPLINKPWSAP